MAHSTHERSANPTLRQELTPRQLVFAAWVATGMRNQEIAERTGVTHAYVKAVLVRIYERSGMADRLELANRYAREELVGR
jgi:two-component system nitrate/nitrite response regulator NarL